MPTVKIPINEEVFRNTDEIALNAKNSRLYDGYVDQLGASHGRPAIKLAHSATVSAGGTNATGLYYWAEKGYIFGVFGEHFVRLIPQGKDRCDHSSLTDVGIASYWNSSNPPTFCNDGTYVFAADGGRIIHWTNGSNVECLSDTDAPVYVSHVAYLDGYILCNSIGTNKFYWSNVNDSFTWEALNFASAAGSPDNINALHVVNREIYLFGPNTLEIWEDDGETPFSRVPGGFLEVGCIAPYSIVNVSNVLYWLDNRCRIVRSAGRNVEPISTPFDKEISEMIGPSTCRGYVIPYKGFTFVIFNFISDHKTFVYNLNTEQWSQWGGFDSEAGGYGIWPITAHCFVPPHNANFVGATGLDAIYALVDNRIEDELRGPSALIRAPIRLARITGHLDHGTSKRKRSNELRIRAKRGVHVATVGSELPMRLLIRWRDDNANEWSEPRSYSLGVNGNREMIIRMFRNGVYRTRQWEFVVGWQDWTNPDTSSEPAVFLDAEEDVDLLAV